MTTCLFQAATTVAAALLFALPATASPQVNTAQDLRGLSSSQTFEVFEIDDGTIVAADVTGTYAFDNWDDYLHSVFFLQNGGHCGVDRLEHPMQAHFLGSVNDCTNSVTNPAPEYDPQGGVTNDIPVVVHVLYHNNGNGNIPDARITEQIQILNDDFGALSGGRIQFHLATEDPNGNPTDGITRTRSNTYYNDGGNYASALGWDTNRYLNIYTNTASGNLGYAYVPNGGGVVGSSFDGVRILWRAFGYTNYTPYHLGRTTTHEVGHYLGLHHTFNGGCHSGGCYTAGDLICDTNREASPNYSGCSRVTCGSSDPVKNFMDYSEDACMDHFTPEQMNRSRCTLANWRSDLWSWEGGTSNPPGAPSNPSPSDDATGVSASVTLAWSGGSGATSHNVYFGTSPSPSLVASVGGTSYSPGALADATTYYWRAEAVNGDGSNLGPVWSFTTASGGPSGALFSDDFESAGFGAGGWNASNGNARVKSGAALSGLYGAELKQTTAIETSIALNGASTVSVSYGRQVSGMDAGANEVLTAAIYENGVLRGSSSHANTGAGNASFVVGGLGGGNITLRFSTNANRKNEKAYVDHVTVTAQ